MPRYFRITSAQFGPSLLGLPISARLVRRLEVHPAGAGGIYVTSVQTSNAMLEVHLIIRDISAAENLTPGQDGDLMLTVAPAAAGQASRELTVSRAVLIAVELSYQQSHLAEATLKFLAEADTGEDSPFAAEDSQ